MQIPVYKYVHCLLSGLLDNETLKSKIAGVTGDGAFAKGNAPFKNRMSELLEKTVVVRWDPLHLINRAHIEARGKKLCENSNDEESDSESIIEGDEETPMQGDDKIQLNVRLVKELIFHTE